MKSEKEKSFETTLFNQLCTEYDALPEIIKNTELGIRVSSTINTIKESMHDVDIAETFALERQILQLVPKESLGLETELIYLKYRHVLSGEQSELLENIKSDSKASEELLRRKLDIVLRELHKNYLFFPYLGKLQNNIIRRSIIIIISIVIVITSLIYMICAGVIEENTYQILTVITIATTGAVGGYISLYQRIQNLHNHLDPLDNYLELKYGQSGYFISPLLGGVFALLLFFIFKSQIITSDMFPKFNPYTDDDNGNIIGFFSDMTVASNTDYAKVLIWSFIAGFAERFVPDTLEKFVARSNVTKNQSRGI